MEDKIKELYSILNESRDFRGIYNTPEELSATLSDDAKVVEFYDILNSSDEFKGVFTSVDEFKDTFSLKKKGVSSPLSDFADMQVGQEGLGSTFLGKDVSGLQEASRRSSMPLSPSTSETQKPEPIQYEQARPTEISPIAYLNASSKYAQYMEAEAEGYFQQVAKDFETEQQSLIGEYQKKIEENPDQYDTLKAEAEQRLEVLWGERSEQAQKDFMKQYSDDNYRYVAPEDVKLLKKEIESIFSDVGVRTFEQQNALIEKTTEVFLSRLPEDQREAARGDINHIIAKAAMFDESGNPTVFGWKHEARRQQAILDDNIAQVDREFSEKYPEYREVIDPVINQMVPDFSQIPKDKREQAEKDYYEKQRVASVARQAQRAFNKVMSLPDNEGAFFEGMFREFDRSLFTAGLADIFDPIAKKKIADKVRKGEASAVEQTAYNLMAAQDIAENSKELGTWYKRGTSVGKSAAFMAAMALTSIPAKLGAATAAGVFGKAVSSKVAQNVIKGFGSAVARTPLLPIGYEEAITRMTGSPMLREDGNWTVDEETIEPTWKAILKGTYANLTEAFAETGGSWFAGTKAATRISSRLGFNKIPRATREFLNVTGVQPWAEPLEEYLVNALQPYVLDGKDALKEAWSGENIWETFVVSGLMSGFFGGVQGIGATYSAVQRKHNMQAITDVGKDNVARLRDVIENNDQEGFNNLLKELAAEGKTPEQVKSAIRYAHSIAQVKGAAVAQETIPEVISEKTGAPVEDLRAQSESTQGELRFEPEIEETTPLTEETPANATAEQKDVTEPVSPPSDTKVPPTGESAAKAVPDATTEVINVSVLPDSRELKHTKGLFRGEGGDLYKSSETETGEKTQEHAILTANQDLETVVRVGGEVQTSEGAAFGIERLSDLEQEDSITLDEYNKVIADARELDKRGVWVGESPVLARDKNGKIKMRDFSMATQKSEEQQGDKNYETESAINGKALDFLSENDRNYVMHQNEVLRKQKTNSLARKDTPIKTKGYRYALRLRPFSKGAFPEKGFVKLESEGTKKKDGHFGIIEFSEPLAQKDVDKFELEYKGRSQSDYVQTPATTEVSQPTEKVTAEQVAVSEVSRKATSARTKGLGTEIVKSDITLQGNKVGEVDTGIVGDNIRMNDININTEHQGKGVGTEVYRNINRQANERGGVLVSSEVMSDQARGVWDKLVATGEAVRDGDVYKFKAAEVDKTLTETKPRIAQSAIKGLNNSSLNGLDTDNRSAISYLNEYAENYVGSEEVAGAEKITGITGKEQARVEKISDFAVQLNFYNPSTRISSSRVLHFKTQEALDAAMDQINSFVDTRLSGNIRQDATTPTATESATQEQTPVISGNNKSLTGEQVVEADSNRIVDDKSSLPLKSTYNEDSGEIVLGQDIIDDIRLIENGAKSMDKDAFGDLWLQTTSRLWDAEGKKNRGKYRVFEAYFRSLVPKDELFSSRVIQEVVKGTFAKRNIVSTPNITIKAHSADVADKIDDKGREVLNDIVAFISETMPNKKLDISIGEQPISVAGSDGFRMTIPNVDSPISDMFPYDFKLVIPAYNALENQGVDRRTLWAAHDFFHEMSHTEGIEIEKEADAYAVKMVQEFTSWRAAKVSETTPTTTEGEIGPPVKDGEATETKEGGKKEYRIGQRAMKSDKLAQEVKDGLAEKGIDYVPRAVQMVEAEVKELVNLYLAEDGGMQALEGMVYNTSNGLHNDTRTYLSVYIAEQYDKQLKEATDIKDINRIKDKYSDLIYFAQEQAAHYGRGVRAQRKWQDVLGSHPDFVVRAARKAKMAEIDADLANKKEDVDFIYKTIQEFLKSPEFEKTVAEKVGEEIDKIASKRLTPQGKKKIDDFFDGMMVRTEGRMFDATLGVPIAVWNGSVLAIKKAVLLGVNIYDAITAGVDYINEWHRKKYAAGEITSPQWQEKEYIATMKEKLKPLLKKTDTSVSRKQPSKSQSEKIVDKLYEKTSLLTKAQLRRLIRNSIESWAESGILSQERFKNEVARAMGKPYLSTKQEIELYELAKTLSDVKEHGEVVDKAAKDLIEEQEKEFPDADKLKELRGKLTQAVAASRKSQFNAQVAAKKISEIFQGEAGLWDTWTSLIKGNLLTTASLTVNVVANLTMPVVRGPKAVILSLLDIMLSGVGYAHRPITKRVSAERHPWLYKQIQKLPSTQRTVSTTAYVRGAATEGATRRGLKTGLRQLWTGQLPDDLIKREIPRGLDPIKAAMRIVDGVRGRETMTLEQYMASIMEALPAGYTGEIMFRLLNLGDRPFREAHYSGRLSEIAKLKGIKGDARTAFMNNPDEESHNDAMAEAYRAVWQNDNAVSDVIKYISNLSGDNKRVKDNVILQSMVVKALSKMGVTVFAPYVKTPTNIIREAFEYACPLYSMVRGVEAAYQGNRRLSLDFFAKATVGSAISWLALQMFLNGILSPPPSDDDDKERQMQYAEERPSMVNLSAFIRRLRGEDPTRQKGDVIVTYKRYGIPTTVLNAHIKAYAKTDPEELRNMGYFRKQWMVTPMVISSALDESFLSGMSTGLTALLEGGSKMDNMMLNISRALSAGFYPNTAALVAKTFADENYIREIKDLSNPDDVLRKKVINDFKDRMFMGKQLPTKVSVWGERVERIPSTRVNITGAEWLKFAYMLFPVSQGEIIPEYTFGAHIWKLYKDSKWTNEEDANKLLPSVPSAATEVGWDKSRMTSFEYEDFQIRVGKRRAAYAEAYVGTEQWELDDIETKANTLSAYYSKARREVMAEMFDWTVAKLQAPSEFKVVESLGLLPFPSKNRQYEGQVFTLDEVQMYNEIATLSYIQSIAEIADTFEGRTQDQITERASEVWSRHLSRAKRLVLKEKRTQQK